MCGLSARSALVGTDNPAARLPRLLAVSVTSQRFILGGQPQDLIADLRRQGRLAVGRLLIVTNLLDLPAWIIALIYRYRWTIEVFFRFFKHVLRCQPLLSQDPVGIEIQAHFAIIACMLTSLGTGRKPTLRTYEMICHYFAGLAAEDELLAHLAKLKKPDP